jgi:exodeoxyribonuclease VII large subunit
VDTLEQRIAAAHRDVVHTTEREAVTAHATQRRLSDLETRIDRAYQTHVDRELDQLETRIETGYRDRVADARVTTTQTRTRQLWVAVAILGLLLLLTLFAVVAGLI